MSDYSHSSELFLSELLRIASDIVWKNPSAVSANEINVDAIEVEQYMLAVQGKLTFELVYKFDEQALLNAGISSSEASIYANNHFSIPSHLKSKCLKSQIDYTIANYVEKNDYYRMLNGLPNLSDKDYVYNIQYPEISNDTTPLHLLDNSQLYTLESKGYIQAMIEKHPDKKYLRFLTNKKISIYNARSANDFAILWITDSQYNSLIEDFKDMYNSTRNMVTTVYYNKSLQNQNSEYFGFIALLILFSTINHMQYKFLDADMSRDFYDEESLRIVYDSYSVPYYQSIPVEFHKKIVKNMNILMSHKGSTKIFYDLCEIFGLKQVDVYEYYMMKSHKIDNNGKPIFLRKSDGEYDLENMYDIYFSKVALNTDPMTEMLDLKNYIEYNSLTKSDPYWFDDLELRNKIYSEDYNYMQSKYIGIQTTFNLMKIIYENSYYMKLIIDNKPSLAKTSVYNNATHSSCNIFDLIIYTCALICKKYGFAGNLPVYPHEVGKVLGFNFQQDLSILKENISKDEYLKNDKTLLSLLDTTDVYSLESVRKVYGNLTELRRYLVNKMSSTREVDEYWAYYNLYNTMMYSEYLEDVFLKSDGHVADTYSDLLSDINQPLYIRLNIDTDLDIDEEITDMLYLIKNSCTLLSDIQYADSVNIDGVIEYLFKLLDFFKSAKSDLTGYEITYSLVSKAENIMKIMSKLVVVYDDYSEKPIEDKIEFLTDCLVVIAKFGRLRDHYRLFADQFKSKNDTLFYTSLMHHMEDCIVNITNIIKAETDNIDMIDYYIVSEVCRLPNVKFNFGDDVTLLQEEIKEVVYRIIKHDFVFEESFKLLKSMSIFDSSQINYISTIAKIITIHGLIHESHYTSDAMIKLEMTEEKLPLDMDNFITDSVNKVIEQLLLNPDKNDSNIINITSIIIEYLLQSEIISEILIKDRLLENALYNLTDDNVQMSDYLILIKEEKENVDNDITE